MLGDLVGEKAAGVVVVGAVVVGRTAERPLNMLTISSMSPSFKVVLAVADTTWSGEWGIVVGMGVGVGIVVIEAVVVVVLVVVIVVGGSNFATVRPSFPPALILFSNWSRSNSN